MATLNLSTNGPSINKSYRSVVDAPPPTGPAAASATYGQWAIFAVSAPLANAFDQNAGGKESVLKVQSTGAGELVDLIDEFSDGRIQFAFVKVKDPNTTLAKNVLIAWCGEGVPERTKGYFTSHLAAVSNTLRGYHVQITARTDRDLTPDGIVQKVSDASGSKYSGGAATASASSGPPPPVASKPVFGPTRISSGGAAAGFNPLAAARSRGGAGKTGEVDADGWGSDAPPVTRTQLEKVPSAYQPTKVNMGELSAQKSEPSRYVAAPSSATEDSGEVVRGGYQPVGKVDIAAIRRQAQQSGSVGDDRPTAVKGAYEPVGKVDIAAIRARAQPPTGSSSQKAAAAPTPVASTEVGPTAQSERLTALPRPRVANKFGPGAGNFTGTKAPTPGSFGLEAKSPPPPSVGAASRTFADEGGKTPAQIWAEKKARDRGTTDPAGVQAAAAPMVGQTSGGGEWKSGYTGKTWAPVATTTTGRSGTSSLDQQRTGADEPAADEALTSPAGGVGALRDRFKGAAPMGGPVSGSAAADDGHVPTPPPLDTSSKPNAGVAIPGLPTRPQPAAEETSSARPPPPPAVPRSPTPPTPPPMRADSPIRIAMPVGRGQAAEMKPVEDDLEAPALPTASLAKVVPAEEELTDGPSTYDAARAAGEMAAASSFGAAAGAGATAAGGKRALVQYDYEKAEDNEIELREGEYVVNIDMVDEDWWMGENARGETGLFPSNYVELVEDGEAAAGVGAEPAVETEAAPAAAASTSQAKGPTALALYDYEAAEDNELGFAEGAQITGLEFPDEDWWFGHHNGQSGLFPANYVQLEE